MLFNNYHNVVATQKVLCFPKCPHTNALKLKLVLTMIAGQVQTHTHTELIIILNNEKQMTH